MESLCPAGRLKPFGMRLVCLRRGAWDTEHCASSQLLDQRAEWQHVHAHLPSADLIFLTCTQNEVTRGMVNQEVRRTLGPRPQPEVLHDGAHRVVLRNGKLRRLAGEWSTARYSLTFVSVALLCMTTRAWPVAHNQVRAVPALSWLSLSQGHG